MVKLPNANLMRNPFKFYRYEVVGAYRDFIFSTVKVPTRSSMEEDGYDDITEFDAFENFSDEIKLRYLPLSRPITENEYMEHHDKIILSDVVATQEWASEGSDSIKLLKKLSNKESFVDKIEEEKFLSKLINADYCKKDGSRITVEDIDSFDMNFIYYYHKSNNGVEINVDNIIFKDKSILKKLFKENNLDSLLWASISCFKYYFNVDYYFVGKETVFKLMGKEHVLSPVMVLDGEFYLKVKDKIRMVGYDCSMEK